MWQSAAVGKCPVVIEDSKEGKALAFRQPPFLQGAMQLAQLIDTPPPEVEDPVADEIRNGSRQGSDIFRGEISYDSCLPKILYHPTGQQGVLSELDAPQSPENLRSETEVQVAVDIVQRSKAAVRMKGAAPAPKAVFPVVMALFPLDGCREVA